MCLSLEVCVCVYLALRETCTHPETTATGSSAVIGSIYKSIEAVNIQSGWMDDSALAICN